MKIRLYRQTYWLELVGAERVLARENFEENQRKCVDVRLLSAAERRIRVAEQLGSPPQQICQDKRTRK